ncbi:MAG: hypothetical protein VX084_03405, partial [Planctomycetota bacterium]|nr:hypothetical protein [Planctomycetota bacterium]
ALCDVFFFNHPAHFRLGARLPRPVLRPIGMPIRQGLKSIFRLDQKPIASVHLYALHGYYQ